MTYPADELYAEVGYVAYHFHWSLDSLLDLEHPTRRRFIEEIARLNERAAAAAAGDGGANAGPGAGEPLPEGTFRAGWWAPPAGTVVP